MTLERVSFEALLDTRDRLIADVQSRLTGAVADFLLSVHDGDPAFALIGRDGAAALPAVRWKLLNIERLKAEDPAKHAAQRAALEEVLAGAA